MIDIPKPDRSDVSITMRMLVSCWVMYGLASVVVLLRLFAKLRRGRLGIDDVLMVIALLCGLVFFSLNTARTTFELGRHFYYLTFPERVDSMKLEFLGQPPGILCPVFGRIAFAFTLLDLIGPAQKVRRWFIYIGIIAQNAIVNILTIILIVVQCKDFATLYDPVGHPSKCWSTSVQSDFGYFQGASNTVTDICLTTMPAFIVWQLQITKKLKIGLSILLGMSSFAMIASIVRTALTARIADRSDFTYNTNDFLIWCTVENGVVIIAASVPMLRSLFLSRKPSTSSYEMQSDYHKNGGSKPYSNAGVRSHITSRAYPAPGSSEENILPVERNQSIAKSITYTVEYEITPNMKE